MPPRSRCQMRYLVVCQAKTIELSIRDEIGPDTARAVHAALAANPDATLIRVKINSVGGNVDEGLEIYQALALHPARVECLITSLAASIASVIACAADKITMAHGAEFMVHNPYIEGTISAGADDLRSLANNLDTRARTLAEIYSARSGQTLESTLDLMKAETYLDAKTAKDLGFCEEVIPLKTRDRGQLRIDLLPNAPLALVASVKQARLNMQLDPMLLEALGLGPDATLEDVLKAIGTLKEAVPAPVAEDDKPEPPAPAAAEDDPDKEDALMAQISRLGPKTQARILAIRQRAADADRTLAVLPLLAKIPATLQAWAAKQSPETLTEYLAAAGASVQELPRVAAREKVATEAQIAVAKATGVPLSEILGN